MSKFVWWLIVVFGCGLIAAIIYFALPKPQPVVAPPALPTKAQAPVAAPTEPEIRHPVPQPRAEKPLPALAVSDATLRNELSELVADKTLLELFHLQDVVRHIVATIDNLPRKKLTLRLRPIKNAPGKFLVTGRSDELALAADNSTRYSLYMRLAEAVDTGKLVALYVHFYPLFQQAYQELGFPKGYFNDRLIEVIDHMLQAPELQGTIKLTQPKIMYLYADPAMEARSAGEKILMRIGNDNAAKLKAKLRDIRDELLKQTPKR